MNRQRRQEHLWDDQFIILWAVLLIFHSDELNCAQAQQERNARIAYGKTCSPSVITRPRMQRGPGK